MSIFFPNNPYVGQVVQTGGNTWRFDGVKWVVTAQVGYGGSLGFQGSLGYKGSLGAPGQANVVYGDNPPTPGYDGLLWFDTNAVVFTAYSEQANTWISLGGAGPQGNTGFQGSFGFTGSIGYTGSIGIGYAGSFGYVGSIGYQGSIGTTLGVNSQTSAYIAANTDNAGLISITTGGVTINTGIFTLGQNFIIYNNSGVNQTITQGGGVTLRLSGTATQGNRTLAQYGLATVICVSSNGSIFTISGPGIS